METTLWMQAEFFVWSAVAGAIAAFVYDLFRAGRRMVKTRDVMVNVQDVIFLVLLALIVFAAAYKINGGEIRWYGLFGVGAGFLVYRVIVKDAVVKVSVKIVGFIIWLFLWMIKIILAPVVFLYKLLKKPVNIVVWYTSRGMKRASSVVKVRKERISRHIKASKKAMMKK